MKQNIFHCTEKWGIFHTQNYNYSLSEGIFEFFNYSFQQTTKLIEHTLVEGGSLRELFLWIIQTINNNNINLSAIPLYIHNINVMTSYPLSLKNLFQFRYFFDVSTLGWAFWMLHHHPPILFRKKKKIIWS